MSGFKYRKIDVAFTLGKGAFGEDGTENTVTLTGLRVSISVVRSGGGFYSQAEIRIYGMDLSDMNKLSTLGKPVIQDRFNAIGVSAGDEGGPMRIVFQGNIKQAWADFNGMPNVPFIVLAFDAGLLAVKPIPVNSYSGAADVATVLEGLCKQLGITLENNGVSSIVSDPYLHGAAADQIKDIITAAIPRVNFIFENVGASGGTLAIWPAAGKRAGTVPLIAPETGMVGYPAFTENGIVIKTGFDPTIKFGASIEVRSDVKPACGFWQPFSISHDLEAETPGGAWFTTLQCNPFGHFTSVPR